MLPVESLLVSLAFCALTTAIIDPAISNSKGKCPTKLPYYPAKVSTAIQAAECSHNTRTSTTQTFAVFTTDHQYDSAHGAPYGTCKAYTFTAPTAAEVTVADEGCWTFFWNSNGESYGSGTGCIRSPDDGTCGCENSNGTFVYGGSKCS